MHEICLLIRSLYGRHGKATTKTKKGRPWLSTIAACLCAVCSCGDTQGEPLPFLASFNDVVREGGRQGERKEGSKEGKNKERKGSEEARKMSHLCADEIASAEHSAASPSLTPQISQSLHFCDGVTDSLPSEKRGKMPPTPNLVNPLFLRKLHR